MDRLHAVRFASLLLCSLVAASACSDPSTEPAQAAQRFQAVAAPKKNVNLDAFCDVRPGAASPRHFAMPELAAPAPNVAGWRWLNVWATWCAPCVEEMPMIASWAPRLASEGAPVTLTLLSVDATDQDVATWQSGHPGSPATLRLRDPQLGAALFQSLGLDSAAPIPVHAFIDPQGNVRCARAGAIHETDYAAVKAVLTENR